MYTDVDELESANRFSYDRAKASKEYGQGLNPTGAPRLLTRWARHQDEVLAAQRLRYHVFCEEMGARLSSKLQGVDEDVFDPFCEHLLVIDEVRQIVVGTYRLLTPVQAKRIGGLYSETEFDLVRLWTLRSKMVELGRSCVHPEYRNGSVIMALWGALGKFMQANSLDTMIGCASVSIRDGGHLAAGLWKQFQTHNMASIEYRVQPRLPLPLQSVQSDVAVQPPALLRGYLKMGCKILGSPAWDPDFNCADFPVMMRLADLPARYRKHFLS